MALTDKAVRGRLGKDKQLLYINNSLVTGVQSIQGNFQSSLKRVNFLGMAQQDIAEVNAGAQVGAFSIEALAIANDTLIQFTGEAAFNGYVINDLYDMSKNYSFTSGYLTSYSSTASVDSIPQINAEISVLGNIGKISPTESAQVISDFAAIPSGAAGSSYNIVDAGNIAIGLSDFNTNSILSYNLQIDVERNVIYGLGSRHPLEVKINYPIEAKCSFTFEIDDYTLRNMRQSPCSEKVENLTIDLNEYQNSGNAIIAYSFSGMTLISESYNANVDDNTTIVNATYRGYLGNPVEGYSAKPALPNITQYTPGQVGTTGCYDEGFISGLQNIDEPAYEDFCVACDDDGALCDRGVCISPTPSNSISASATPSPTPTSTQTPTSTPTQTQTATPSLSDGGVPPSNSPTPSNTTSNTPTSTPTPTSTATPSNSMISCSSQDNVKEYTITINFDDAGAGSDDGDTTYSNLVLSMKTLADATINSMGLSNVTVPNNGTVQNFYSIEACCDEVDKVVLVGDYSHGGSSGPVSDTETITSPCTQTTATLSVLF